MDKPDCYLVREEHVPARAAFPLVDAHNHLWGKWKSLEDVVRVMDAVGVVSYCDLTANVAICWGQGGYVLGQGSFSDFRVHVADRFPGRFYGFTTATFVQPTDRPLFRDAGDFVRRTVDLLHEHVAQGARGLKILKELGLRYVDGDGRRVAVDDPRLAPIWEAAARLGIPVLLHQSDPVGFFLPITPANEHYETLRKFPSWSFADPRFPRKHVLIRERDTLLARHPRTQFLLAHVANYPEDLGYVSELLDRHPNVAIDFSARLDELGRQPYAARQFLIRYQDRVCFGTDMPASVPMYRCYLRFLETYDEYFFPPDYDGTFERRRWAICGLGLPRRTLARIYYQNALRLIPGLRADFRRARCAVPQPQEELPC
jgi:hypothetical protein